MAGVPRLDLVHKAIGAGSLGQIQWKDSALRRLRDDEEMVSFTASGIRSELRAFVLQGNSLTVRNETRAEWLEDYPDDPHWYRAILPVAEFPKGLFVEVKLVDDADDDPWVEIVSVHRQL